MTTPPDVSLWSELVEESEPVEFQTGLIGLSEWKHFVLIKHPQSGPLSLLQSLNEAGFSLIVADPRQIIPDYGLLRSTPAYTASCRSKKSHSA
jgi:flagellar assembly factor FliW